MNRKGHPIGTQCGCLARRHPTPRMTARVIPTILRRGSQRRFTHVKRETCIVGMTLAVILEMVPYCLSWCEWDAIHGSLRPFLLLSKGKAIQTGGPCPVVQPATAFAHRLDLVHQVHQVHLPGSGWLRQALWGAGEDLQPCSGKCLLA
jgi:hypothetical protein